MPCLIAAGLLLGAELAVLLFPLTHGRKPVLDTDRPLRSRVEPRRQAHPVRRSGAGRTLGDRLVEGDRQPLHRHERNGSAALRSNRFRLDARAASAGSYPAIPRSTQPHENRQRESVSPFGTILVRVPVEPALLGISVEIQLGPPLGVPIFVWREVSPDITSPGCRAALARLAIWSKGSA